MRVAHESVAAFHRKHKFPRGLDVKSIEKNTVVEQDLDSLILLLRDSAVALSKRYSLVKDLRLYRAHLLVEELAETLTGLQGQDEVALADGLADLLYVAIGTADTFNIPIGAVFDEVHKSNMTKQIRDKTNARMRDKGEDYVPPAINDAIHSGRRQQLYNQILRGSDAGLEGET